MLLKLQSEWIFSAVGFSLIHLDLDFSSQGIMEIAEIVVAIAVYPQLLTVMDSLNKFYRIFFLLFYDYICYRRECFSTFICDLILSALSFNKFFIS